MHYYVRSLSQYELDLITSVVFHNLTGEDKTFFISYKMFIFPSCFIVLQMKPIKYCLTARSSPLVVLHMSYCTSEDHLLPRR